MPADARGPDRARRDDLEARRGTCSTTIPSAAVPTRHRLGRGQGGPDRGRAPEGPAGREGREHRDLLRIFNPGPGAPGGKRIRPGDVK